MKRNWQRLSAVVMLVTMGLIGSAAAFSQGGSEVTPIPQETLDAAVAQLFRQTAEAAMNQTATAVAEMGGTATAQVFAAPTQTVEAIFRQAMTATAQTILPAYDGYEVIDVQEFEMRVGSGNTAAHLSPDGTHFVHIGVDEVCFYELDAAGVWSAGACFDDDDHENRIIDGEEIRWSPDNRWLAMPTFRDAFMLFRDTDVRVYDTQTGAVTSLTNDDADGSPLDDDFAGFYDIAPQWLDADTLLFVRYSPDFPEGGGVPFGAPRLMQIEVQGGEPQEVAVLPSTVTLSVYAFAISDDGTQIAYSVDHRDSEPGQGVWVMNLDDTNPVPVIPLETRNGMPLNMAYSATNQYLTLILAAYTSRGEAGAKVLDIANKAIIDIDPERTVIGAAWSPRGNGLAYVVRDMPKPEENGLYITSQPGVPGRLVLEGNFYTGTCCGRMPMVWAENDTILIARSPESGVLLVKVG